MTYKIKQYTWLEIKGIGPNLRDKLCNYLSDACINCHNYKVLPDGGIEMLLDLGCEETVIYWLKVEGAYEDHLG